MKLFSQYPSTPRPVSDYDGAMGQVEAWQAENNADVIPSCQLQVMTHGRKTERVIVFFHGYTACPNQFSILGDQFFKRGYNVLIPRAPLHGYRDRLTEAHTQLKAETLIAFADRAVDVAQGLGERVSVAGLSMGGILASWVAQNRADVEQAMIISPAMSFNAFPFFLTRLVMWASSVLPNRYGWWDPVNRANIPSPPYIYPRFSTRALAQLLRLGFIVLSQARQSLPAAKSILVVTNAGDQQVNHRAIRNIIKAWRKQDYANIRTCEFTPSQDLLHDFIDPAIIGEKANLVYPILVDLMTNEPAQEQMLV